MTHPMIVKTAKGIAAKECEMRLNERTGGQGVSRRFRRIWLKQNKALIKAFQLEYGYTPSPEELFGELNWTKSARVDGRPYVQHARENLAKMLGQQEIRDDIKRQVADALIADRREEYAAPAERFADGLPPARFLRPDRPGRIERELFGDN